MPIKITLTNSSRVTRKEPISINGKLIFPRHIYQRLSSLVANKTILADYEAGTLPKEYMEFLDELNKINTGNATDAINELNVYLGALGTTETYPYEKDGINISPWFESGEVATTTRNVVHNGINVVNGTDNIVRTK